MAKQAVLLMLAIGAGCGSAVEQPPKFISAQPVDGATGLTSPLAGSLRTSPAPAFSDTENAAIASGLSLATWPDLAPVPSTVAQARSTSGTSPYDEIFTVAAADAVPDGWYVVLASSLPGDVIWGDPLDHHVMADGTVAVRLRVGSAPAVSRIDFCSKSASTVAVVVTFSEGLLLTTPESVPAAIAAGAQTCPFSSAFFSVQGLVTKLELICDQATLSDAFTVTAGDGAASPEGVGLATFQATVTPAALGVDTAGCSAYKVEP